MNKYWSFLISNATKRRENAFQKFYLFSSRYREEEIYDLIKKAKKLEPIQTSSAARVKIVDAFVIKEDNRPFRRRFRTSALVIDASSGLQGTTGEAINTLVANSAGYPGHTLLAYQYSPIKRRATLVFEKLQTRSAFDRLGEQDCISLLMAAIKLLHQGLEFGLFHGDCNLNNLFFDDDLKNGKFIDFELAVKRNCSIGLALALQLSILRDWRLDPHISKEDYQSLVLSYINNHFPHESKLAETLFLKFYGRPLKSPERINRLNLASDYKPDILSVLSSTNRTTKVTPLPKVSFCISCMNREGQLKETLPHNIDVVISFGGSVEICLVNFIKDSGGEQIDQWIKSIKLPDCVSYYTTKSLTHWHASRAKNTTHMAARGEYVINLDCDNFLHVEEIKNLLAFNDGNLDKTFFWGFNGTVEKKIRFTLNRYTRISYRMRRDKSDLRDGSYGRIGMPKKDFIHIGGYDESLPPMGGQDYNLFRRFIAHYPKHQLIHVPAMLHSIKNSKLVGLQHTDSPDGNWYEMNRYSRQITEKAIKSGDLIANKGKIIGVAVQVGSLPPQQG